MRLTIKKHNEQLLNDYAKHTGLKPGQALDYLLTNLRLNGIEINGNKLEYVPSDNVQETLTVEQQLDIEHLQNSDYQHLHADYQSPDDGLLRRLINAGLEAF